MELAPGKYAVIAVRDNGSGIPESIRKRVMEPFFTTKPRGQGTGLGLYLVQAIAKRHGGSVSVRNLPERGCEFCLRLPH